MACKCWSTKLTFRKRLTLLPVFVTLDCCSQSYVWLCCSVSMGRGISPKSVCRKHCDPLQHRWGGQLVCCTSLGGLWGFLLDRFLQNGSSCLPARLVVCHLLGHRVLLCFHLGKPEEHEKTLVNPMSMHFCFMVSNAHLMEIINGCPLMSVHT